MSDDVSGVVDGIDGALSDWSTSPDAMRWAPDAASKSEESAGDLWSLLRDAWAAAADRAVEDHMRRVAIEALELMRAEGGLCAVLADGDRAGEEFRLAELRPTFVVPVFEPLRFARFVDAGPPDVTFRTELYHLSVAFGRVPVVDLAGRFVYVSGA